MDQRPSETPRTVHAVVAGSASPNLDLLRAIAVLAVYVRHLLIPLGYGPYAKSSAVLNELGGFGVFIFFVHTSLVLMMSLERLQASERQPFRAFYVRRLFRIYPLSIVCIGATLLFHLPAAPWWPWSRPDLSTILTNFLLCMNLFYKPALNTVNWSLPYEVQMYLVLPLLYLAGKVYGLRGIIVLWCCAVVVALIQPHVAGRLNIAQYAPCFIAGVASYFIGFGSMRRRLPFLGWPLVIAASGGVLAIGAAGGFLEPASWVMCLIVGLTAPMFVELRSRWLGASVALLARYSYGIYLTHLFAMWVALVILKDHSAWLRYGALVVLSGALPVAVYHLVEAPMIGLGTRLAKVVGKGRLNPGVRRMGIGASVPLASPSQLVP
jgi:peptidoglycan/LPS O-acetylase OafA/YrhL